MFFSVLYISVFNNSIEHEMRALASYLGIEIWEWFVSLSRVGWNVLGVAITVPVCLAVAEAMLYEIECRLSGNKIPTVSNQSFREFYATLKRRFHQTFFYGSSGKCVQRS